MPAEVLEAVLARHGSPEARTTLADEARRELASTGSTSVHAVVAVGDVRLSGLVLREAVSSGMYARFVVGFTEAVRGIAGANLGWFDKFTGDGFVVFWLYPEQGTPPTEAVSEFCQSVLPASQMLVENLRKNSRNFPAGVGLGIGLDSGPCELVLMGDAITILGSPIVGATRMSSGARAGETIANIRLGSAFERGGEPPGAGGPAVAKIVVRTKEYPKGQEAYRLEFPLDAA
jgi:class 3 adenylate cyclase